MPICIAGMHRSGTSMVARLLHLSGVYLGNEDELVGPASDNPDGFWENRQFVEINDQILTQLNSAWDMPLHMPSDWDLLPGMSAPHNKAMQIIEEWKTYEPWAWKDPRNSLSLPFWQSLIPDLKVLICVRNPLEVARSLSKRGYSSQMFGLSLWNAYNQQLLSTTQLDDRIVTHYDSFFHDPRAELQRIFSELEIEVSPAIIDNVCSIISPSLRSHRSTEQDLYEAGAPPRTVTLYAELCAQAGPVFRASVEAGSGTSPLAGNAKKAAGADYGDRKYLAQLESRLVAKEKTVAQLGSRLVVKEKVLIQLESRLVAKEKVAETLKMQLADLQQHLSERSVSLQSVKTRLSGVEGKLARIENSRVWRLGLKYYTLRGFAGRLLRKVTGRRRVGPPASTTIAFESRNAQPFTDTNGTVNPIDVQALKEVNELVQPGNGSIHHMTGAHPSPKVLFISHDAHRFGAQILLLHFLRWLKANSDIRFEILLKNDGELRSDFEALAPLTVLNDVLPNNRPAISSTMVSMSKKVIRKAARRLGFEARLLQLSSPRMDAGFSSHQIQRLKTHFAQANIGLIYSNTITNGHLLAALSDLNCPVICHVHELGYWIKYKTDGAGIEKVKQNVGHYVAVSQAVKRYLVEDLEIPNEQIDVVYEFIPGSTDFDKQSAAQRIRKQLGIPADALIVGASGSTDWRKGSDVFVQLARTICQRRPDVPIYFVWVGGDKKGPLYGALWHDVQRTRLEDRFCFVGSVSNPLDYFAAFDVFVLASREDPFPLVNLEAASLGKPIVCFDDAGGAQEFVDVDCGFVVPYLNIEAMADCVVRLLDSPDLRHELGENAARKVNQHYKVEMMAPKLLGLIQRFFTQEVAKDAQAIKSLVGIRTNSSQLNTILTSSRANQTPRELFGDVKNDFWFWLNTEGVRQDSRLAEILPALPDEAIQLRFTGSSGDVSLKEAFSAYRLFRQIAQDHLAGHLDSVLDFGCGWGRTIRFFLRDLEPQNIWGIDCFPEMIDLCRQTNRWCQFELTDPLPPTSLPNDRFDLIYCYSVFSHLSEDAQQRWLVEFSRILRPGGLLIATTWPREFIIRCAELRKQADPAFFKRGASRAFLDTAAVLKDYDSGKYVHAPVGGGDVLAPTFFGETCISRTYVLNEWTTHFEFVEYIDDRGKCPQNVIVVQRS